MTPRPLPARRHREDQGSMPTPRPKGQAPRDTQYRWQDRFGVFTAYITLILKFEFRNRILHILLVVF